MIKRLLIITSFALVLAGCIPDPPKSQNNVCEIFREYPKWYWAAQESQNKWGVPVSVQMAIIHQESRYKGGAKPPRTKLLWVIPWTRPTSAYGYSQALDGTWQLYQKSTGSTGARSEFDTVTDFIGWYANQANKRAGIPKNNAYDLYLAYHEGVGGYMKGTYKSKQWLINVAKKVQNQANLYHNQLVKCGSSLPKKPWYQFW